MAQKSKHHGEPGRRYLRSSRRRSHGLLSGLAAACLCVSGQVPAGGLGVWQGREDLQTIMMYSTPPGYMVLDTEGGSVFSQGLAAALKGGAETFVDAFQIAAERVRRETLPVGPTLTMDAWRPVTVAPVTGGERRLAFLVGNSKYRELGSFVVNKDVAALDDALKSSGFEVVVMTDVDVVTLQSELEAFVSAHDPADVVFLFLGGLGMSVDNADYFVGINESKKGDVMTDSVRLGLLSHIAKGGVADDGTLIVVYDACRDIAQSPQSVR